MPNIHKAHCQALHMNSQNLQDSDFPLILQLGKLILREVEFL